MAPRKGSPVPLIIFIVLFVFSAVGLVLVAMELASARDLTDAGFNPSERDALTYTRKQMHNGVLVGLKQALKLNKERIQTLEYQVEQFQKMTGSLNPEKLREDTKNLVKRILKIEREQTPSLMEFIQMLEQEKNKLKIQADRERQDKEQRVANLKAEVDKTGAKLKTMQTTIDERDAKIEQLNLTLRRERDKLQKEAKDVRTKLDATNDKMLDETRKLKDEVKRLERIVKVLTDRLREVQKKKTFGGKGVPFDKDNEPPDGKVILVERDTGVIVNIGRKKGVRRGLRFEVFSVKGDGTRIKQGDLEIKTVFPDISRAILVGGESPVDVVSKGDIIVNPAFDPGRARIFVADTVFDDARKQKLRDDLKKYGSALEPQLTIRTDYLIIGPKRGKFIDQAEKWGIPLIREDDLLPLLGR